MSQSQENLIVEKEIPQESFNDNKALLNSNSQISSTIQKDSIDAERHLSTNMKLKSVEGENRGVSWYFAPAFLLFWVVLFFAVVKPIFFKLPKANLLNSKAESNCSFIAERAERILYDFEKIGPKVVGSNANENMTVELLLNEIEKVRDSMDHKRFELEVDVQQVSGAYMHWTMINIYQGVQNVVVKLSPKATKSPSYLLINSHFDSKPGSPGSGDDGAMVVIMLEILRVLSSSRCSTFAHPIVFLFNGAEENPLQASHGFITKHKWAKNCKAVINLDSAGSGHREILFQSGLNHPWLINHYRQHVKRPFANSMAEELFQSGIIPSDTDFRNFRDFGKLPGLDLAHSYNGYVYHTAFDKMNVIPLSTLQITGDNILALAQGFANATELVDTNKHRGANIVFYDFMGIFLISYSEIDAMIINTIVSLAAVIVPAFSLWRMSVATKVSMGKVVEAFCLVFLLHLVGFVLAFAITLLIATAYDMDNRSLTWYTNNWLVIGQYICPSIFGLSLPTLLFFSSKKKHTLPKPFMVQLALHSQAMILAVICMVATFMGIRTAYLPMISILFYVTSLVINLITTLHRRGYYWIFVLIIGQITPFLYFSFLIYHLLHSMFSMLGRFGSGTNPDLLIAVLCVLGTFLSMGFLIPILSVFRRPKSILLTLLIVSSVFIGISLTKLGFPYRSATNVGRVNFLHVRRVFYNYYGEVERNESGYFFDFQDRRKQLSLKGYLDIAEMDSVADDCDKYMMCGLPIFNHRMSKSRKQGVWLPSETPIQLPGTPTLDLISKTIESENQTTRFEFKITGPPHFSIFLNPIKDATIVNWSFLKDMLQKPYQYQPPYHIFFSYGNDNTPLSFYVDVRQKDGRFDLPLFELGLGAHYVSFEHLRGPQGQAFIKSFPEYIHVMEWPSSYERYIF